ncbi:MAG: hypothetical protein AAB614_01180 [Patescibacteria group bacterium]
MDVGFLDFVNAMISWGWVALPIFLFFVWKTLWMDYIRLKYRLSIEWIVLEIRLPQIVEKTPKVMEYILAGLYSIKSGSNIIEKYIDGKNQLAISLEIASINGAIHFFIRTPEGYKKLITSQILAQYPEADIYEVDDYTLSLPQDIPNKEYDMWGTELLFTKEDAYPIRTYKNFKEEISLGEGSKGQFIDPISSMMEILSQLDNGEQMWIHYLIKPADDKWQKKGRGLINRILGKEKKKLSNNVIEEIFYFFHDMVWVLFGKVPESKIKKDDSQEKDKRLSPGEKDTVEAIEESISKHGFHTNIRILYIARRELFSEPNTRAIWGTFNQFSTFNLNGFKKNDRVTPGVDYFFVKTRDHLRKRKLYLNARNKIFKDRGMILNIEELATVYHIPSVIVETPSLPKVEHKKVNPPSSLPVI